MKPPRKQIKRKKSANGSVFSPSTAPTLLAADSNNIPRNKNGTFAANIPRPSRKTGKIIKCFLCGKEVYKEKCHLKKEGHNYCSIKCWNEQQFNISKRQKWATCPNCGKTFKSIKYHKNGKWIIYCSLPCWREHKGYTGNGEWRDCKYCGKKFWTIPSRRKQDKCIFCSKDCMNAHKTATQTFFTKCLKCGKPLVEPNSRQKRSVMGYFCGRDCFATYAIKEKSVSWHGGWSIHDSSGRYTIFIGRHKRTGRPIYKLRSRVLVELECDCVLSSNWGVLHLNSDVTDDRLCNLYLCESMSELRKIQNGSFQWPIKSNIQQYKNRKMPSPKITCKRFANKEILTSIESSILFQLEGSLQTAII